MCMTKLTYRGDAESLKERRHDAGYALGTIVGWSSYNVFTHQYVMP